MSVSWRDHFEFGEGDGRLADREGIKQSIARWRDVYGATRIFLRDPRHFLRYARHFLAPGVVPREASSVRAREQMDEMIGVICAEARAASLQVYAYLTIFDEGWPPSVDWRRIESWQSLFTIEHPEYLEGDRSAQGYHYGVLCYANPEARRYRLGMIKRVLEFDSFDGLFLCTRSQSRPADHADQYGFDRPVVEEYERRYGVNVLDRDFDLDAWRRLRGEGLTQLLREVRAHLKSRGLPLALGVPRGDYLGPPVGNLCLDWRAWVREGLVDDLVIDQRAVVCPSTWRVLWGRLSGYGYVQNYQDGVNMPGLVEDLSQNYGPLCRRFGARLFAARQWVPYDATENERLAAIEGVTGVVLGSFRLDNPRIADAGVWPA